jgi:hypothetical protein
MMNYRLFQFSDEDHIAYNKRIVKYFIRAHTVVNVQNNYDRIETN